ncbi:hypothetical protein [Polaribacter septentrionalilitoris]|uniref:hypothetical protein n=1 Tax=Polaribacter septentrionalilitoris TaxID=2494657 RepID=UPI0013583789|nr:hypothetical protein [Polaribacter septentrionalilitoris]
MKKKIQQYISNSIEILQDAQLKIQSTQSKNSIVLDEKYFHEKFMNAVNISEAITEFRDLKEIKKPVLYWFELVSSKHNQSIREEFINGYREPIKKGSKTPYRNTSSYKKTFNPNSSTLYVGKVEIGFWGRLVTHLGYAQSYKTAGMQLFHWYKPELFGDIKLNYIVFDENMKHLIVILEKLLAKELEPLIGRY